ncbi:transcription antitermination factor NusB [Haoranjiania flava]|uniref:Transcription antitermination protein NusB n=1 Tax=Haoranjiania flava TaxID=1856322 RepID=A0AAE3LPA1_9BACT|nr:transcription antitermination factor NusB [Haoranjiania flava]MCU7693285.1 transcription antitermination factor NusB [Haoranjiania flava]
MVNRRNIRIKVMQLLYSLETMQSGENKSGRNAEKELTGRLELSRKLLFYILHFITEIAQYAEIDAKQRASRYIVREADKNVNIKIAGNEIVWALFESEAFKMAVSQDKLSYEEDKDLIKKIYIQLTETDEYQRYILEESRNRKAETKILQFIFSDLLLGNETFISLLEEKFENWDDDGETAVATVMHLLDKPRSLKYNLVEFIGKDKLDYAKDLLRTVLEKDTHLTELIKPKLNNWDEDRIALIDMILLKMGISELLYFETIPPKVTINEYIDIAKEYSTENSGQFINGTLDSIKKDLEAQNKMNKIDFKKNK